MPGSWSTGGNLATARTQLGGCGTQDTGLSFGGSYSGTRQVKTEEYNGATWSSGGDLVAGRKQLAGCGTQTAGLSFGGDDASSYSVKTEEYNGTAWANGGNLGTGRRVLAGAGTQTAGLSFGGYCAAGQSAHTEEHNGAAWSAGGDLITARSVLGGCGTQSAGLSFGGHTGSGSVKTEEYNGTAWFSGGDLSAYRYELAGAGTQSLGLSFGGYDSGGRSVKTEEYNGSSWSTSGDLAIPTNQLAGCGTQEAGLSFGGGTSSGETATTEEYSPVWFFDGKIRIKNVTTNTFDGKIRIKNVVTNPFDGKLSIDFASSVPFDGKLKVAKATFNPFDGWIHLLKPASNLFDGEVKIQYAPTNGFDAAIRIKDAFPSLLDGKIRLWDETTNLFDGWIHLLKPASNIFDGKTTVNSPGAEQDFFDGKIQIGNEISNLFDGKAQIHTGFLNVWSYGGNLLRSKEYMAGTGTRKAGLCVGGRHGGYPKRYTEEYNAIVWSSGGDLATTRQYSAACGIQSAALHFGGYTWDGSVGEDVATTEEYNGTAWSAGGDLPFERRHHGGAGTQSAGLSIGGYASGNVRKTTNEYNGTAWSSGGDLITARTSLAGAGTQSAGLGICGNSTSNPLATTEEYNGTAWSSGGDSGNAKSQLCGCGTQSAALNFMGIIGSNETAIAEEYDGTSWTLVNSLNSARCRGGGCGTTASALAFGGCCAMSSTEEYGSQGSLNSIDGRLHLFEFNTLLLDGRVVVTPPGIQEFDGRIQPYKIASNLLAGKATVGFVNAWRSIAQLPSIRTSSGSAGISDQTGLVAGGMGDIWCYGTAWSFDGLVWTQLPGTIYASVYKLAGAGDASAGLMFGGEDNDYVLRNETDEWNGAAWVTGGTLSIGRASIGGCGTQNAALCMGGGGVVTEEYNGTSWGSGGDLGTSRSNLGACGTQTAGLCFSSDTSEEYNGSAWSAGGSQSRLRTEMRGCGVQTAGMCIGGTVVTVEKVWVDEYDGTSWASIADMLIARKGAAAFGTVDGAIAAAGFSGAFPIQAAEKYSSVGYDVFDGKVRIKDEVEKLLDGKVYISNFDAVVFDGKANLAYFGSDLFDGKLKLYRTWRESLLGGFGEPYKTDLKNPLGISSSLSIRFALVVTEIRSIVGGLGDTLEYLLHVSLAQTERQQVVNHLSNSIDAIQALISDITFGDPLSGRLPLLTSLQSEFGIQSLVNELSGIMSGVQKLLTALTENVSSHVSLINELALQNDIQSLLVLLGSMPDPVALYPDCTLNIYLEGLPIKPNQITDLSFVMDRGVTFDVLSFSSTDVRLYAKLQEIVGNKDSTLEVQYKGTSWFFLIEEVSGYELSFNVWGRSIAAAKSDAPFEDSVNFVLETDTLASIVAEDLVPNLSVTWNVVDWTIMADWSVDGTPVQMLKELADSVGAVVRSYPDGTGFYVDEKYTTRPVDLPYAASVEDYDRDVDLMSLDASRDLGTGTNSVTVHGYSPFSKYSIRLEAESCVDVGNPAVIKVYPALDGVGYKLIASDGSPVYQYSLSEEHIEIVSFVGGKGSVSYPIMSLKSITWDGATPAGFEYTAGQDEIVLTDETLAAVGEVVYSTRYDVWHGTHSGEGQLLVVCYLDEGGGIVAKVYFGEGDREADDIDRPILTSIEAAVAAGQAFLDDTSYNRLIRAIIVPCSDVSDGDVVSVLSDLSGVTGNTFVLRHEVSARVDNEALKITSNLNVVQFEV